jgi:hypothetical protein
VKMLLERYQDTTHEFLPRFDRRIFILRDPRDNVISRLVYYAGTRLKTAEPALREAVLEKFRAKERDPESVSVLELFQAVDALMGGHDGARHARRIACRPSSFFADGDKGFLRLRYEDFVDGRLEGLAHYVGFEIQPDSETAPRLRRVSRTRSHGYWRSWFTDEDHDFFVTAAEEDLRRMGYADLAPYRGNKAIGPNEISEYFERQLRT